MVVRDIGLPRSTRDLGDTVLQPLNYTPIVPVHHQVFAVCVVTAWNLRDFNLSGKHQGEVPRRFCHALCGQSPP